MPAKSPTRCMALSAGRLVHISGMTRSRVGAALCRERAAKRPRQCCGDAKILGALRTPFATQGRSYKGPCQPIQFLISPRIVCWPTFSICLLISRVGAALCRERAAKRPRQCCGDAKILGALRTPFATQGRSYKGPCQPIQFLISPRIACWPTFSICLLISRVGAALCRERAAKRPRQCCGDAKILGALRTPFATQGRSYKGPCQPIQFLISPRTLPAGRPLAFACSYLV